jgi:hypothetical protein
VIFEPKIYLSNEINSFPGKLALKTYGNCNPVGQMDS